MSDIVHIVEIMGIKNTVITHIEDWGKSYDDYNQLEKQYKNIRFAFDGMVVEL